MKSETVEIRKSTGRSLYTTIFRHGGRKLLAKGHVLNGDDIRLLEGEGLVQVWVAKLEDGEVGEDQAVSRVAEATGCGCLEIRMAAGGRANLFATEDCCVLVDAELLQQVNLRGYIVIATLMNFAFARAGQRIATVKSTPFAVSKAQLDLTMTILQERGPILQARPMRAPSVAVLYTDPFQGDRARQLFERVTCQRLERFGVTARYALAVTEEEAAVAGALEHLLATHPHVVLVASTTAPAGPDDVIGRAMTRIESHLERFLAPVEPGNLFLLGYRDGVPILSAPGCFRSVKPNVVDLVLPPMLAQYRMTSWEVASLGHGGVLDLML